MEIREIAKDILIALINRNALYTLYKQNEPDEPAKRVGDAYKIILKSIHEATDEARK